MAVHISEILKPLKGEKHGDEGGNQHTRDAESFVHEEGRNNCNEMGSFWRF